MMRRSFLLVVGLGMDGGDGDVHLEVLRLSA